VERRSGAIREYVWRLVGRRSQTQGRRELRGVMAYPLDTSTPLGRLAAAVGGQTRLAELLGVAPRTIRAWAAGERLPGGPARLALERLYRRHKIDPTP
jgi:hypothetical protein